jgi:hypothetical protein
LQLQRNSIALQSLACLHSKDFAEYREKHQHEVSNNTVRLELALQSHLFTITIKGWSLSLEHVLKN